jgi:CPA2 family monovalent cation:H+ antiporter-2
MPEGLHLLVNLSVSLGAALVLGLITERLRLSPIVGYLLAGASLVLRLQGLWPTPGPPVNSPRSVSCC